MGVKENLVKKQCLLWLAQRQIPAWENNTGAIKTSDNRYIRFGYKGSSDIIAILPNGLIWCIETKSKNGRQRKDQKKFQKMIEAQGGVYTLAKSERDLEPVLPLVAARFNDTDWWNFAISKITTLIKMDT